MSINWKLRFKNKAVLSALVAAVVLFASNVATALGVPMPLDGDSIMNTAEAVLGVLVLLGVVIDPTTTGIGDSHAALLYEEPATNRVAEYRADPEEEVCG